jgi:SAM-dependent methyltransferase
VDVGAGIGLFAVHLADWFSARVVAVEPAAAMRAQAQPRERVSWMAARAEQLAVRHGVADLVWISDAVHYLDLYCAAQEACRVLKPGGRVVVRSTFPDQFEQTEWMRWFPSARAVDAQGVPTVDQIVTAFGRAGLELAVRDGKIVQAGLHLATEEFFPQMWKPFETWVTREYPQDVAVMYERRPGDRVGEANADLMGRTWWRLSEESIRLWDQHTRDYVASGGEGAGSSPGLAAE